MKAKNKVGRRDFLRALGAGAGAAIATSAPLAGDGAAETATDEKKKQRAHYQANSPEVQEFYRVNRYPSK